MYDVWLQLIRRLCTVSTYPHLGFVVCVCGVMRDNWPSASVCEGKGEEVGETLSYALPN